jgi:hypothetical protein
MIRFVYNRTTTHIDFGTVSASAGAYTMNRCGAITKGNLANGKSFDSLADLQADLDGYQPRKVCKTCLKALAAVIAEEAAYQDRLAASLAPATEAHDLGYAHADQDAAADAQPADVKAIRQDAEAAAADLLDAAADAQPADVKAAQGDQDAAPVAYRPWGTDVLPQGVTMAAGTRVLSGPVKAMLDLYKRGLAQLNDEGDLVLM